MMSKRSKEINAANALDLVLEGDSDLSDLTDDDDDDDEDADEQSLHTSCAAGSQDPKKNPEPIVDEEDSENEEPEESANADQAAANETADEDRPIHVYRWRKKDIPLTNAPFQNVRLDITNEMTPLGYFKLFWPDDLTDLVVEQTNLYSTQMTGHSINTNKDEMEQFLGMHMKMGIVYMPSHPLYWSRKTRYAPVADVMSLKRFGKLRQFLHFVDNMTYDPATKDKLFKISPTLQKVREQCLKIPPEECHSVDEQIIMAKTKYSGIRQYNAKKPVKWGFKNLVQAGASGFMYDFYLYAGKDGQKNDGPEISKLQKCARVVARLCDYLPKHSNHKLFCDNWFITLDLLLYLKRIRIHVCGTVRSNRLQGCALNADKDLK